MVSRFGGQRTILAVLVFFTLMSLVMTYPLVTQFTSAVPGPPWDNFVWLYDLWWFRHAIFDLHEWPSFNPDIFQPFGYDLTLSETMLANKMLVFPILALSNEVVAYNSLLLLSFVLSGLGMYLLVVYLTQNRWAGVIAGLIFAYCPFRMHAMAAGWLPLISTQWVPFLFLNLERMIKEHRTRYALWAGVFLAISLLSSWYYVYVIGFFSLLYLLLRLWPWRRSLGRRGTWRNLVVFGGVAVVLIAPVAVPVIRGNRGAMAWSLREVEKWAASLEDFFLPNVYHPLWGRFMLSLRRYVPAYPWYAPGFVFLGFAPVALAILGWRRSSSVRPVTRALLWLAVFSFILALGTTLHLGGRRVYVPVPDSVEQFFSRAMSFVTGRLALNRSSYHALRAENAIPIPLPAMLFYLFIPFGDGLRTFYRFGLMTMFAVAVLSGIGVAGLLRGARDVVSGERRVGRVRLSVILLAVLAVVEFAVFPLPFGLSRTAAQPLDEWMRTEMEEGAVMQYPLVRALNGPALYRTAYHRRPVTYGHGTFYPQEFLAVRDTPLGRFPAVEALDLLREWGVRYVLAGTRAYDEGWGDLPGQDWESVSRDIEATERLRLVGTWEEEHLWYRERVSDVIEGNLPPDPITVDEVRVYELR